MSLVAGALAGLLLLTLLVASQLFYTFGEAEGPGPLSLRDADE